MIKAICDSKQKYVQYEKFNRLCDLFFYTPGLIFCSKNDSQSLYQIMSSMQRDRPAILLKERKRYSDKERNQHLLVERFGNRIMQKFKKIGVAFRHFDRNFDNQVSFKEFRIVCEEMDLRFSSEELRELFSYLDSDGGGSIGY